MEYWTAIEHWNKATKYWNSDIYMFAKKKFFFQIKIYQEWFKVTASHPGVAGSADVIKSPINTQATFSDYNNGNIFVIWKFFTQLWFGTNSLLYSHLHIAFYLSELPILNMTRLNYSSINLIHLIVQHLPVFFYPLTRRIFSRHSFLLPSSLHVQL